MLTSIKGSYNNGHITLTEVLPFATVSEVIVTFLPPNNIQPVRKLGGLEHRVTLPEDFNEPLENMKDYML